MHTRIFSSDPAWSAEAVSLLLAAGFSIRFPPTDPNDEWEPAALAVVQINAAHPSLPESAWGFHGLVLAAVESTELLEGLADATVWQAVVWPPAYEQLRFLMGQARQEYQRRPGIAGDVLYSAALQKVVEMVPESIEISDEKVRFLYVNPAFERITGYPMTEVLGRSPADLLRAGTHDEEWYDNIMRQLRNGRTWEGSMVGRRRDGALSFQEATIAPLRPGPGPIAGFVAIKHDIDRDRLAQRALEADSRRMHRIVQEAADAMVVHSFDGRVWEVNQSACEMLGYTRKELLDAHVWDFDVTSSAEVLREGWDALMGGNARTADGRYKRVNGELIPVNLRSGIISQGGEYFVVTVARDISERVTLEENLRRKTGELEASLEQLKLTQDTLVRREKLAALGGLVAGVAHEINTPLGVTLTALSVVDERVAALKADVLSGTATRRRFIEHLDSLSDATRLAVENGRRAASLVTSFKKVAVDQASEAMRLVEFPEYLHHVVDSLRPLIKQAKVRVEVGGDSVQIHTRPGQIVQVLTNLISNAITHGLEDHPDPTITIYARRAPKGMWLVVEDNGWGMSEEVRRRAFEPFFTTRMGRGGSGLGLHIVYNIVVEALGGEIEVDSAPGQGTCFRLFFPHQLPSLRESSE